MKKKLLNAILIATFYFFGYNNVANAQWIQLNSGTTSDLYSVCFTDANTGYAAGSAGTIIKTTDAGTNWTTLSTGIGQFSRISSIFFPDATTGYAVVSQKVYKTVNAGATWSITGLLSSNSFMSCYFTSASTGYVVGGVTGAGCNGEVKKTSDGGVTWTSVLVSDCSSFNSVFFTDASTGYVAGTGGRIKKTTDAGSTWTYLTTGVNYDLEDIYFVDANTGFAVGSTGTFLKTTNAGASWTYSYSAGGGYLQSVYFTDVNTGYVGGRRKTIDGGATWTAAAGSWTANAVSFTAPLTGYAVCYSGQIFKTTNGGGILAIENYSFANRSFTVSPNPAKDYFTINLGEEEIKNGQLDIYNLRGEKVYSQILNKKEESLSCKEFSAGMYFVRVRNGEKTSTEKLIIQ